MLGIKVGTKWGVVEDHLNFKIKLQSQMSLKSNRFLSYHNTYSYQVTSISDQ